MSNIIYEFNIAAFVFLLLLAIAFSQKSVFPQKKIRLYRIMLFQGLLCTVSDTLYHYCDTNVNIPLFLHYLLHFLFLASYTGVFIHFYVFFLESIHHGVYSRHNKLIIYVVSAVFIVLTIATPFTNLLFYYDSDHLYHTGPLYFLWFVLPVYMLIHILLLYYRYLSHQNHILKVSVYYLCMHAVLTIYVHYNHPMLLISSFGLAVFLFLLSFTLGATDVYIDKTLDCYNKKAFIERSNRDLGNGKSFATVAFTLVEYPFIMQLAGQNSIDMMTRKMLCFLIKTFGRKNVYALNKTTFAIYMEHNKTAEEQTVNEILTHFKTPYTLEDRHEILTPIFCIMSDPGFAKSGQQIIEEIVHTIQDMNHNDPHIISYATGKYLAIVQREQLVTHAMKKAIEDCSFEVYYQPIYDLEGKCVKSLEALLRLQDKELGFIPPDEFIQIAEQNGMINEISSIAFRKVCTFIKENNIKSLGIEYIEYNLSSVECENPLLASNLLRIMNEFHVTPSQINFEITETAQARNVNKLIHNMEELIHAGSTFSMDDYGTGYSTTHYLIKLPLHIVKIDKSILWPAMKDEKSFNVLQQLVATIKSIDKKIVVEGVETQEMVDMLKELKCDYLQGFFYSKPVPSKEIVQYLKYANQLQ